MGLESEEKRAVMVVLAERLMVQVPVPVQTPDQPMKVEPVSGVAERVTVEFSVNVEEQEEPQEREPPETVPPPVPPLEIVRV
jgi:hypothetical protein